MRVKTEDTTGFRPVSVEIVFESRHELKTMYNCLQRHCDRVELEECEFATEAMYEVAEAVLSILENLES